jgi:hypothetical protein
MRYPTNAPTATASMIQPLYVMNNSLSTLATTQHPVARMNLHDEERIKHLHRIQQALNNLDLLLGVLSSISSWAK